MSVGPRSHGAWHLVEWAEALCKMVIMMAILATCLSVEEQRCLLGWKVLSAQILTIKNTQIPCYIRKWLALHLYRGFPGSPLSP